jgi:hypothetical protein
MTAGEIGDPIAIVVQFEADDGAAHRPTVPAGLWIVGRAAGRVVVHLGR